MKNNMGCEKHGRKLCFPCMAELNRETRNEYLFGIQNQPERSKREDSECFMNEEDSYKNCGYAACGMDQFLCPNKHAKICEYGVYCIKHNEMRCSEHCGNTVRDK